MYMIHTYGTYVSAPLNAFSLEEEMMDGSTDPECGAV